MAVFTYIAKRSIQGGHVLDETYQIEIGMEKFDVIPKAKKKDKMALDGVTIETILQNSTREYSIGTALIDIPAGSEENADWQELADSVVGGEQFTFDAFGTIASPNNVQDVKLIGVMTPTRVVNQVVKYSFNIRIV